MNGRSSAVLAAFAMLSLAVAGCLEAPAFLSESDLEISALERRELAEGAAQAWSPGAQLVGIFTLELSEANEDIPMDPAVGNGQALLWYYAYASADGQQARAFRVTADGSVHVENETMGAAAYGDQVRPVGNVTVDSDAAVEAARANETFAAALAGERPVLAEGVADFDGVLGWYFAAVSNDSGAIAVVDATTGALLWVEPFAFNLDWVVPAFHDNGFSFRPDGRPTHVEQEGRLDADARQVEIPFTVEVMADEAVLALDLSRELPTDALRWTILDAEGEKVDSGWAGSRSFGGSESAEFEAAVDGPGAYTLVLEYAPMALVPLGGVDYRLMLHVGEMTHEHGDQEGHDEGRAP